MTHQANTAPTLQEFYTVAEYAQLAKLNEITVRRLIYAGDIPAYKVGRSVRIPASALNLENLTPVLGS